MEDGIAVITSASGGIGRATAITLARHGLNVVLAARNLKALREVAAECRQYGIDAIVVQTDATKEEDVRRLAEEAVDHFGSITVWVNNSGNAYGVRTALRQFKIQGFGTLLNIAAGAAGPGPADVAHDESSADDCPDIHVYTILPEPHYSAHHVADAVLELLESLGTETSAESGAISGGWQTAAST
jgi:NAD(P)-dependent dehydrogenase (short-subunit alcohol dehydrogenase family)